MPDVGKGKVEAEETKVTKKDTMIEVEKGKEGRRRRRGIGEEVDGREVWRRKL